MKKLLALVMSLAMVVVLFAACGGTDASTPASTPAGASSAAPADSTEPTPAAGGAIRVNLRQEPPELNSILTTTTGSMNVLRHLMDGLVLQDGQDNPIPGMAETWEYDEATFTYTFHLRQGSKWSNGEEVTAHDFIFAWTQLFTPEVGAPYAGTWAPMILGAEQYMTKGTDAEVPMTPEINAALQEGNYPGELGFMAVDDYTIQMTTTNNYEFFLAVLAFPSFFPVNEKGYTEIGADKYAKEADAIVTNGPFTMTEWVHESTLTMQKNPDYWNADTVKLDEITFEMINDSGTAFNSFVAGEIDMIETNAEQSAQLTGQGVTVQYFDDASCWYFEFNNTLPGLNNQKVRTAMTLGVDAVSFINDVVKNHSTVTYSFTPPAIQHGEFTAAVGNVIPRVTDGDYSDVVAMLEEGLAEENLTIADFKPVLIADDTTSAGIYCAFFQEQWKTNLGVDIQVEQMTYKNRIERMQQHDFSIVMAGWGPDYNDPMTFLSIFTTGNGNNHTQYTNPDYDALIADAYAESDLAKREQILVDAEHLLMTDMPIGPIYNRAMDFVTSDRLSGVVRTGFQDINLRYAEVVA